MDLIKQDLYKSLEENFYAPIPFAMDRDQFEEAMAAFFRFLEEPEDIKSHINFSIAPKHRRGDVGYTHRNPEDHIYNDSKDFFHFHPAIFRQYPDFIEANPVVKDFLLKAQPIWDLTFGTVDTILKTLDPIFPGIHGKVFDTPKEVHLVIRFLKYDWATSEKYLAKPHFDAGSFTLAIAESTPGLRIGSGPDNLALVTHKPGNAVFMMASNFQTVMETDKLAPGWHDVIQLDETRIGLPFARWAIVAFIDAHDVEALSRSETHKFYNPEAA